MRLIITDTNVLFDVIKIGALPEFFSLDFEIYGLTNIIINTEQYSIIVGVVIASAVIPTLIANKFFLPGHLLEKPVLDDQMPDIIKEWE